MAYTLDAPPAQGRAVADRDQVWPWLIEMGYDRAGTIAPAWCPTSWKSENRWADDIRANATGASRARSPSQ